jgi:hypothetical protein
MQAGLAGVAFFIGGMVKPTWAKLLFLGAGSGATIHAVWQVANHYVMIPLFGTTAWGIRAYAHEIQANNNIYPATPAATGTAGLGAPPVRQFAAPPVRVLPAGQPARMPTPIAAAARPFSAAPVRSAAPSPAGTRAAGLGQNGSFTPPAGMVQVQNLANGNCPDGSTVIMNPDNLDMPFCVVPQLATPTPPAAAPPPATFVSPPPPAAFMVPPAGSPAPPPNGSPPVNTSPPPPPFVPLACNPRGSQSIPSQLARSSSVVGDTSTPLPNQQRAACCGTSPCSCGSSQMGAPPPADGPRHPMFAHLLAGVSGGRGRARAA